MTEQPAGVPSLLTDALLEAVGQHATYHAPEPLGRAAIRYFSVAVGDRNPLYTDDHFARSHGWDGVIAPPTLVLESNQYMPGDQNEHGYAGHSWDLEIPGTRMLRGGHTYTFGRPARPDDVITAVWRIDDVTERQSSSGSPMVIVTASVVITAQDGELLATNEETIIYQVLS